MWDPPAIAAYEALGVPGGAGWVVAWRLAPLGDVTTAAAAAATYSISPAVIEMVMGSYRGVTDCESIMAVRDDAVLAGLDDIAPSITDRLGDFADDLWRAVDSAHRAFCELVEAHHEAFLARIKATAGPRWSRLPVPRTEQTAQGALPARSHQVVDPPRGSVVAVSDAPPTANPRCSRRSPRVSM